MGRFKITSIAINRNPEVILSLMSQVIVFRAEYLLAYDMVAYTGISEHFDEVKLGETIPIYNIRISGKKYTFWREGNEENGNQS